jgi:hypothetical protein
MIAIAVKETSQVAEVWREAMTMARHNGYNDSDGTRVC